jgi:hypothetical protein
MLLFLHGGVKCLFAYSSANATPAFEGRGGQELGTEISNSLATAYQSSQCFDLTALCILPGQQCWKLYVDILVSVCIVSRPISVFNTNVVEGSLNESYYCGPQVAKLIDIGIAETTR